MGRDQPAASIRTHASKCGNFARDLRSFRKDTRMLASGTRRTGTFTDASSRSPEPRLPARLCHAGNHSAGSQFPEGDPGEPETAQVSPTTAGHFTAVHDPGGTGIARKHAQAHIVLLLLQFVTEFSILRDCALLALVSLDPALLGHGRASLTRFPTRFKGFLSPRARNWLPPGVWREGRGGAHEKFWVHPGP